MKKKTQATSLRSLSAIALAIAVDVLVTPASYGQSEWRNLFPMLFGVTYGNGVFVAVGDGIQTSSDGTLWTERNWGKSTPLQSVAFGKGTFVAVGELGTILQTELVAQPRLDLRVLPGSGFGLEVQGEIGVRYRIQATSDFATWVDLGAITNDTPTTVFTDSMNAPSQRFYRVVSP